MVITPTQILGFAVTAIGGVTGWLGIKKLYDDHQQAEGKKDLRLDTLEKWRPEVDADRKSIGEKIAILWDGHERGKP